jgi:lysozyme
MTLSAEGLTFIQNMEAWRSKPYMDEGGKWTVGYGHLIPDKLLANYQKRPLTKAEGLALLASDVGIAETLVAKLLPEHTLTQAQYDALVSFVFNVGGYAFSQSTMRRLLQSGHLSDAAKQFDRWVFVKKVKSTGLVKRRRAERLLFETGQYTRAY